MINKNNILLPCVLSTDDLTMTHAGDPKSCKALSLVTSGSEPTCLDPQAYESGPHMPPSTQQPA